MIHPLGRNLNRLKEYSEFNRLKLLIIAKNGILRFRLRNESGIRNGNSLPGLLKLGNVYPDWTCADENGPALFTFYSRPDGGQKRL